MTLVLRRALALAAGLACIASSSSLHAQDDVDRHELVRQGNEVFHRICSHCHGRNMVNSGTTVYDLRRFPVDQPDRFLNSVTYGKGNMPSFKEVLDLEQIKLIWAYVSTRGGKEM
jgi:cytochrome c6